MSDAPVLITAFNRPALTKNLIASLRPSQPKKIIFAVDGPRSGQDLDAKRVRETQDLVAEFNWNCKLETIFRPTNLGLRFAVADAVSHVTSKFGKVIVVEDDIEVGPNFLSYMQNSLNRYESDGSIAHINGYVVVPRQMLQFPEADRRTRYIESFAWATWERSWELYDPNLTWAKDVSIRDLSRALGSTLAALRWKQTFGDASRELINTWAYRWLATIWSRGWCAVTPPFNLVRYFGWTGGTHTRRKARWQEQPVSQTTMDLDGRCDSGFIGLDTKVERWLGRSVFGETVDGVVKGALASGLLAIKKNVNR